MINEILRTQPILEAIKIQNTVEFIQKHNQYMNLKEQNNQKGKQIQIYKYNLEIVKIIIRNEKSYLIKEDIKNKTKWSKYENSSYS